MSRRSNLLLGVRGLLRNSAPESGQGLAEYALILALIAIVSIIALIFLGGQISSIFVDISTHI